MSGSKNTGRKTSRIVRLPAVKCGHLRKKMQNQKSCDANLRGRGAK